MIVILSVAGLGDRHYLLFYDVLYRVKWYIYDTVLLKETWQAVAIYGKVHILTCS